MVQPISTQHGMIAATRPAGQGGVSDRLGLRQASAPLVVFGAAALWFHYGTAVFFEMIAAGISGLLLIRT